MSDLKIGKLYRFIPENRILYPVLYTTPLKRFMEGAVGYWYREGDGIPLGIIEQNTLVMIVDFYDCNCPGCIGVKIVVPGVGIGYTSIKRDDLSERPVV